ncbi:helix-turn-helix transcriptional regulator [Ornithinimicrobium cerasi]|uniref:helix-turn-helix transcriptional regulator n=1 Tax=Ornithinimicrobium cerasi TaxID=2248773 RepID=UPI001F43F810|nr:helix-turn-helix transcriptional regulator [Ornithinimicrobium cerasi]
MAVLRQRRALALVAVVACLAGLLVVVSRGVSEPVAATRVPVLLAAAGCAGALLRVVTTGPGWVLWRRTLLALALLALAYPGSWAAAVIAGSTRTGGWSERVAVSVATVAHLPVLASFTLLPLLAVSYLGQGTRSRVAWVVLGLGAGSALSLVLFLEDGEPVGLPALVPWAPGAVVGATANLLFLVVVVLAGPLTALLAARRAPGHAARRLASVAAAALGGSVLVMACGALATTGGGGAVVVLVSMYAALATVALGCSAALSTPSGEAAPAPCPATVADPSPGRTADAGHHPALTARENEIVGLLAEGLSNAGIAARLVLSPRTVDAHLRSAFVKLDLPDGPEHNRRVHAAVTWHGGLVRDRRRSDSAVP